MEAVLPPSQMVFFCLNIGGFEYWCDNILVDLNIFLILVGLYMGVFRYFWI